MPRQVKGNSVHKFVIPVIAFVLLSCSDQGLSPQDRDFNIMLKYGVGGRNELDTFQNTYQVAEKLSMRSSVG